MTTYCYLAISMLITGMFNIIWFIIRCALDEDPDDIVIGGAIVIFVISIIPVINQLITVICIINSIRELPYKIKLK